MAVDYWQDRARIAEDREWKLDEQLTQARCRAGHVSAENVGITEAAQALLNAIREDDEVLRPLAANLRTALQGGYTQGMASALGDAVNVYEAQAVIREMIKRLKLGEKLARAAAKWSMERLLRKRISFNDIHPSAIENRYTDAS